MGRKRIPDDVKEARRRDKVRGEIKRKVQAKRILIREYGSGQPIAAVFEHGKTKDYFLCWIVYLENLPGMRSQRYVELKNLRVKQIQNCITLTGNAHSEGNLDEKGLEIVLDYLYAELNARLNKTESKLDAQT